jgi:hypothetical protein
MQLPAASWVRSTVISVADRKANFIGPAGREKICSPRVRRSTDEQARP